MHVSSIGERGLHQWVFEAVDRAVNEVLAFLNRGPVR